MRNAVKVVAGIAVALAVVVLGYAVLTPDQSADSDDGPGMNGHMMYSTGDVGLIALALVLIVVALMVVLLWKEYEPLPPSMLPPKTEKAETSDRPPDAKDLKGQHKEEPKDLSESDEASMDYLVLRLLSGDERIVFKSIMDSGGEVLQKDLMAKNRMSNAKVSRVLDRLLQKGVITKERYGATNKVSIKRES
jgi:hypothetical protein